MPKIPISHKQIDVDRVTCINLSGDVNGICKKYSYFPWITRIDVTYLMVALLVSGSL